MTERDIFLAVLDLPDPTARAAYLDAACGGNVAVRARVEALLRSHDVAGSFLGSPAVAPPDPGAEATLACGEEAADGDALAFLAPAGRPDSLGRLGHYEVLEILGRGGFGIVFRAFDEKLRRVVAVKVLAPRMAAMSPARKRFLREARAAAAVRHENVVQIYAVEEQPLPYLVMEFIPGETLQQRLDRTGPLELGEIVSIGRQIAEGLSAAHGTGLIHRDVKPANVLIESGPRQNVKLTDFGLARAADDASVTQSGVVAGTPTFMAPEQANGERIDHRADLFSLGSVLYAMTTGRPPFRAKSTLAVLKRVAEDTPRPIPEIIPETPPWLCDLIGKLHAKKPDERFASAREVADLLLASGGRKPPEGSSGGLRPPLAGKRRRWVLAAVVLALGLLGLGVTEAADVTNMRGAVIRLFLPEGTLVVEVDDPGVSVSIDGEEMVITGTGMKEIRLKPGQYTVKASKDGKTVREELVRVERNGKQVVRVSREAEQPRAKGGAAGAEKPGLAGAAEEQLKAVVARLKQLNPEFDGAVTPTFENGAVTGLQFLTHHVTDLSPVRALAGLKALICNGREGKGQLADLSPLRGMQLTTLECDNTQVADLSPLRGMPLRLLAVQHTRVAELTPLAEMPLEHLNCSHTRVADLSPLKNLKLLSLYFDVTPVTDLSPLKGMPLRFLNLRGYRWQPDRDATILRSLRQLEDVDGKPVAEFLKGRQDP